MPYDFKGIKRIAQEQCGLPEAFFMIIKSYKTFSYFRIEFALCMR